MHLHICRLLKKLQFANIQAFKDEMFWFRRRQVRKILNIFDLNVANLTVLRIWYTRHCNVLYTMRKLNVENKLTGLENTRGKLSTA